MRAMAQAIIEWELRPDRNEIGSDDIEVVQRVAEVISVICNYSVENHTHVRLTLAAKGFISAIDEIAKIKQLPSDTDIIVQLCRWHSMWVIASQAREWNLFQVTDDCDDAFHLFIDMPSGQTLEMFRLAFLEMGEMQQSAKDVVA